MLGNTYVLPSIQSIMNFRTDYRAKNQSLYSLKDSIISLSSSSKDVISHSAHLQLFKHEREAWSNLILLI